MCEALLGGSGVRGQSRDCELSLNWTELEVLVLAPGETELYVSVEESREEWTEGMLTGATFWLRGRELGKRGRPLS